MGKTGTNDPTVVSRQMLGLQLSYLCNATCRACAFDCSPQHSLAMSLRNAKKVLGCAHDMHLIPVVGLTGGEPFFQLNFLKELMRFVKNDLNFKISISTNCFWARTEKRANTILNELADLGLIALLISVDDFHQEFVPVEYIKNAVNAAVDLNINCILQSMETRTSRKATDFIHELDLPLDGNLIQSVPIACEPVGRAVLEVPEDEFVYSWQNKAGSCSMLHMFITDPLGKVFPCCGTAAQGLPGLGNAFEESIVDIVHHANADPLYNALAAWGGPFLLFKILAENGIGQYAANHYVSACHACHSLFKDQEAMAMLKEKLAPRRVELMAARLLAWTNQADWRLSGDSESYLIPAAF